MGSGAISPAKLLGIIVAVLVVGTIGYVAFLKPKGGSDQQAAETAKSKMQERMQKEMAERKSGRVPVRSAPGSGSGRMGGYGQMGKMGGPNPGR